MPQYKIRATIELTMEADDENEASNQAYNNLLGQFDNVEDVEVSEYDEATGEPEDDEEDDAE